MSSFPDPILQVWSGKVSMAEYNAWRQVCKHWNKELSLESTRKRLVLDLSSIADDFFGEKDRVEKYRWLRWLFEEHKIGQFAEIETGTLIDACEPWLVDFPDKEPFVVERINTIFAQMRSDVIDDMEEAVEWAGRQAHIGNLFLGVWPLQDNLFGAKDCIGGTLATLGKALERFLKTSNVLGQSVVFEVHDMHVDNPSDSPREVEAVLDFVHVLCTMLREGFEIVVHVDFRRDVKAGDVLDEDFDTDDEDNGQLCWRYEFFGSDAFISQHEYISGEVRDFVLGDGMEYSGCVDLRVKVDAFSGVSL